MCEERNGFWRRWLWRGIGAEDDDRDVICKDTGDNFISDILTNCGACSLDSGRDVGAAIDEYEGVGHGKAEAVDNCSGRQRLTK